ncbi:AAA family ATPase [Aneurinibacillus thermoaerophilus]|uniref:AAA family ATPase n=1 Tax=Aneurinibacillus thermoaerophilus TaxID=143495 RepID=UPI002E1FC2E5|nr:AAA family ATPase [Aneurinibacillus thermoaerophilus]MED0738531.1 AAA family ATPase [Aneurinibacillus thermoaerophilus]
MQTDFNFVIRQLRMIFDHLCNKFVEREDVIQGAMLSIIAGQHMLLIGPPGTAKSAFLKEFCKFIQNIKLYELLLSKETTPDELLGPFNEREKAYGRYIRLTANKLPEAHISILDEIFKAKGETLNSLLNVLNERIFIQNGKPEKVSLISTFGASNEYPQEVELAALYDRFLIRMETQYIEDEKNLGNMLSGVSNPSLLDESSAVLTIENLQALQKRSMMVKLPQRIVQIIVRIRMRLFDEGIFPSDRRLKASLSILRANALLAGRNEINEDDLPILTHVLWTDPDEREKLEEILMDTIQYHYVSHTS